MVRRTRAWHLHIFWCLLIPAVALAYLATAAQIADAVRNSPNANQWLRDNADAVANLAIRVESRGETTAFNGSCCSGVLQMNESNILHYAQMTPEAYRQLDLQSQVNAWAQLTVAALQAGAPQALAGMSSFDGRAVDGNLVLACVQLGIGNCQTMLNSGRCNGFADGNGTTICGMANLMAGGAGNAGGSGSGGGGGITGGGAGPSPSGVPIGSGFQQGAGVTMGSVKTSIHAIVVAVTLLVVGGALIGLWRQYAGGRITKPELFLAGQKAGLIVILIFIAITFV